MAGEGTAASADAFSEATALSYDEIAYPNAVHPAATPEGLAVRARLFGLEAADPSACDLLDLGCADGGHVMALADAYPGSRFTGIDLSGAAIARGRAEAGELGLGNVRLEVGDLLAWAPEPEGFDYVVAHGLYAWTPPQVREALMATAGRALRPGGIAVISYNVAPGCNVRRMAREFLLAGIAGVEEPRARMQAASDWLRRGVAHLSPRVDRPSPEHPAGAAMAQELKLWAAAPPEFLAHDILAPLYAPARLPEVAAHAARHGLAYLGDTACAGLRRELMPRAFDAEVLRTCGGDLVQAEHRHDLLEARPFRFTLFRKGAGDFPRRPDVAALQAMHASLGFDAAADLPLEPGADGVWQVELDTFEGPVRLSGEVPRALLSRLHAAHPGSLPVADLELDEAGMRMLVFLYAEGAVQLWTQPPRCGREPGERPWASALARRQARLRRSRIGRLDFQMVDLDEVTARVLPELDGRADRAELARRLSPALSASQTEAPQALDAVLAQLAQGGMLVAGGGPE